MELHIILSTHIVSDIEAIADQVLIMKKGKGLGASRIVSENKPSKAAVLCEASLEDIYLYFFPTKEGEE